jgi:nucleoside-diphosphate-sugar epimerase/predicted dehydrogenase
MRVGIIGSGQIARIHCPLILKQPDTRIVGIADKDVARAKDLAAELKINQAYQDARVMIDEQKPDVVHVLTPPQYHAELSIVAMNQGSHVLVEKPMALTMNDAKKMIEVANQNKVQLCVNHNLVFEDVVQRTIKLTSEGAVGEVVSVEAYFSYNARRNPAIVEEGAQHCHWSYRMNGGPLQDLIPHPASLVMEFIPEIKEIQCIGHNRGILTKGWQDEIRVLIKSDSVIGYIGISLNERPDTIVLTVKGTKGIVQADLSNNILVVRKQSGLPRAVTRGLSGFQLTLQNLKGSLGNVYKFAMGRVDKSGGIGPLISKFYESVRNGGETPISLDKSLRVVDLMNRVWPVPIMDTKNTDSFPYIMKNKNVAPTALVTGASGFIGTHLVNKLLSENIGVRALVRPNSIHAGRLKKFDVDIVEGDLTNAEVLYEATKGVRTIYHAGAALGNNWEEHYQVNIKGTEHLIKAALAHKVERFVHLSTLVVYELVSIKGNGIIREDASYQKDPKRMGPYAYYKIEAEKLILDASRKQDLGIAIVRPGIVIGPMGRVFFPHLGYRYQDSLFILIGKGDTVLPLTYVENTVDGIYKASIEDKAIGQVYNLVDDGEITVRQYLERFIETTGIQARIVSLPYIIPYFTTTAYEIAAHFDLLKKGLTSRAQLRSKQATVRFDNTKAKSELGWNPKVPIEEGLTRTFKWYASQYGY